MPVISWNALVSVFDSYSCVGMVSDSTLISMPRNGAAALTNHSISLSWSSLESVDGWNSLSTHFLAASMLPPALAAAPPVAPEPPALFSAFSDFGLSHEMNAAAAMAAISRILIGRFSSPRAIETALQYSAGSRTDSGPYQPTARKLRTTPLDSGPSLSSKINESQTETFAPG